MQYQKLTTEQRQIRRWRLKRNHLVCKIMADHNVDSREALNMAHDALRNEWQNIVGRPQQPGSRRRHDLPQKTKSAQLDGPLSLLRATNHIRKMKMGLRVEVVVKGGSRHERWVVVDEASGKKCASYLPRRQIVLMADKRKIPCYGSCKAMDKIANELRRQKRFLTATPPQPTLSA